jgi:hypothetical protein
MEIEFELLPQKKEGRPMGGPPLNFNLLFNSEWYCDPTLFTLKITSEL